MHTLGQVSLRSFNSGISFDLLAEGQETEAVCLAIFTPWVRVTSGYSRGLHMFLATRSYDPFPPSNPDDVFRAAFSVSQVMFSVPSVCLSIPAAIAENPWFYPRSL